MTGVQTCALPILLVAGPGAANGAAAAALAPRLAAASAAGPLPFHATDLLPFGTEWNVPEPPLVRFDEWAIGLAGVRLAAIVEIPYAAVGSATVTADSARALGAQVAAAVLQELPSLRAADVKG